MSVVEARGWLGSANRNQARLVYGNACPFQQRPFVSGGTGRSVSGDSDTCRSGDA
jgi:hypothetical protein